MKLAELGKAELKKLSGEKTFNIADVEVKPSKTGNVGYRVPLSTGKVVSFWQTTMDECIDELDADAGLYGIKAGVTITEDGSLIAPGKGSNGFWS